MKAKNRLKKRRNFGRRHGTSKMRKAKPDFRLREKTISIHAFDKNLMRNSEDTHCETA